MAEFENLTNEWEQVLEGTLIYLRTQAATELDYSAVVRMERNAWRKSRELIDAMELSEPDLSPATDELLQQAVSPSSGRQAVTEQVLGTPVDDGPEGVDDDVNREVSEEVGKVEIEELDEVDAIESVAPPEEDEEDVDTAPPGTKTPIGGARVSDDVFDEDLDLDELPDTAAEEVDLNDLPDTAADEIELEDPEEATVPHAPRAPLLSDFDFDDDDEADETVVFSIGGGNSDIAKMLDSVSSDTPDEEEESFDLMPDLEIEDVEELELEELDLEDDLPPDDDTDMGRDQEPAPLGLGASASVGVSVGKSASARVTAGLYGNPNVPTIRESQAPAPRAAAIKINAKGGGGKVMGFEEEEEPLEIGSAEDYGEEYEDEDESAVGGGFSLNIQEYDDEDEWEDEEEYEEEEEQEPQRPVYTGPDPSQVAAVLAQAMEAAYRGDMQGGVELFSDVLDADPDKVEAYVGRGKLYLDLGDYSRAMSDFMTAEDLAPQDPEPQVAIGDLYFARKDYRKAIDYFNGALNMDPNHAMAHCRRGISHYYRKNYPDALSDLQTAKKLNEDIPNIDTYISMAKKKARR